jgi:hypothetical protein
VNDLSILLLIRLRLLSGRPDHRLRREYRLGGGDGLDGLNQSIWRAHGDGTGSALLCRAAGLDQGGFFLFSLLLFRDGLLSLLIQFDDILFNLMESFLDEEV